MLVFIQKKYGINKYSSTPEQINNWLLSAKDAFEMCGISDERYAVSEKEENDLKRS